jgi:hypothetical protein
MHLFFVSPPGKAPGYGTEYTFRESGLRRFVVFTGAGSHLHGGLRI